MPVSSIGDLSQFFQSSRQTGAIKSRLNVLSQQLSSGQYADITKRVGGTTGPLASITREIALLDGFERNSIETGQWLGYMQATLETVDALRNDLMEQTLPVNTETMETTVNDAAASARQAFGQLVSALNKTVGNRSLFAGSAVDQPAVAQSEDMILDIATAVGGTTDAATIIQAIDDWFNLPGGGFETIGYLGDTGAPLTRKIGVGLDIQVDARADGVAFREMMQGIATAAIVDVLGGALDANSRATLVKEAGEQLLGAASSLTQTRAALGVSEAIVEETKVSQAAEKTSFEIARNGIVRADPFDTATELQDVQTQLELHYTVTARLSSLTLANYLR